MFSIAIIIFREVLEVSLVLGVLLAATRGMAGRARWTWVGLLAGVFFSGVVAYFAEAISNAAQGMGQELFNALVLVLAAALIGWTVVWMRRYGRNLTQHFKAVGQQISRGQKPLWTLAVVVALSVLREGSEMVLFTFGVLAQGSGFWEVVGGSVLGLSVGVLTGFALYFGLVKISPRQLFGVTTWLLVILAAGMISQAVGYLSAAGVVPELISPLWDTSRFLSEQSLAGKVLHSLVGYSEKPTGAQFLSYLLTLGVLAMILRWFGDPPAASGSNAINGKKLVIGLLVLFSTGLWCGLKPATAFPKVYSPIIEKGEIELEHEGLYTFDHRDDKDSAQTQKYAIGYGVTEWWATEVYGEWEKNPEEGEGSEFENVEFENRFQLFEQGKYWVDVGLYFSYEFASEDEDPDNMEGKLLLEKQVDRWVHTLNLILEKKVGGHLEEGEDRDVEGGAAWSTRYRWQPSFEPGFEIHYDAGQLDEHRDFEDQELQIGPTLYGKIGPIKYDVGYLFGATHEAPDGVLKWIVEYELRF